MANDMRTTDAAPPPSSQADAAPDAAQPDAAQPDASPSDAAVPSADSPGGLPALDAFEEGLLVGVLIGEGHFGGDGRQPQVTLRMHTDHEALFHWLERRIPGSRLYGPYHHGGRSYHQWMVRGATLRTWLVPLLERRLSPDLDARAWRRFRRMCEDYRIGD